MLSLPSTIELGSKNFDKTIINLLKQHIGIDFPEDKVVHEGSNVKFVNDKVFVSWGFEIYDISGIVEMEIKIIDEKNNIGEIERFNVYID